MGQPVVHFEVIGRDPAALRRYYAGLFGWAFDTSGQTAKEVSEPANYGFTEGNGIPGGVGGGAAYEPHTIFYVGVADVGAALRDAERLGGKRIMGPVVAPGGQLAVGHFADPEGNVVGVAGSA